MTNIKKIFLILLIPILLLTNACTIFPKSIKQNGPVFEKTISDHNRALFELEKLIISESVVKGYINSNFAENTKSLQHFKKINDNSLNIHDASIPIALRSSFSQIKYDCDSKESNFVNGSQVATTKELHGSIMNLYCPKKEENLSSN